MSQVAPALTTPGTARIRSSMESTNATRLSGSRNRKRLGWATGRVEALGQKSALGGRAILQAVTRVKLEQASKMKSWMPTRLLIGEGRTNGEETDQHLFGPPGY